MPGTDVAETIKAVRDLVGDLVFLPELPDRGDGADMIGRGTALLDGLGADLQPTGWRLLDRSGRDQRRARSLLGQDLDVLEEQLVGAEGDLKIQVPGPWTLAATLERPRGGKVLADHGARRELAESLASGVATHAADVRRRVPGARLTVQVDEPALRAVLDAQVPTVSGLDRYRRVEPAEADAALRRVVEALDGVADATALHSCAARLPTDLLVPIGFDALSFDLDLVEPDEVDALAAAYESGVALWPGLGHASVGEQRRRLERFAEVLGASEAPFEAATVVTPPCGLAGHAPDQARRALERLAATARG